jgi:hypothetical protein
MKVWTFTILGGDPFGIAIPGNPPLRHDGTRTIQPLYATQEVADGLQAKAEGYGCTVKVTCQEEPREAAEERAAILALQQDDAVLPSNKCPSCFWLALTPPDQCGVSAWPKETVDAAIQAHDQAINDLLDCPVRNPEG